VDTNEKQENRKKGEGEVVFKIILYQKSIGS
jgi:hypothetical protein